jgi:hypothetical protein
MARAAKAARIIDRRDESHGSDSSNAWYAHEPTYHGVVAGERDQAAVISLDLLE